MVTDISHRAVSIHSIPFPSTTVAWTFWPFCQIERKLHERRSSVAFRRLAIRLSWCARTPVDQQTLCTFTVVRNEVEVNKSQWVKSFWRAYMRDFLKWKHRCVFASKSRCSNDIPVLGIYCVHKLVEFGGSYSKVSVSVVETSSVWIGGGVR